MYVDDYIVFNNQLPFIHQIKTILFHEFEIFNGITIHYSQCHYKELWKKIIMHQTTYFIAKLLHQFGWLKAIKISQEQRK